MNWNWIWCLLWALTLNIIALSNAQGRDELYILIDNAEIHKCKGVQNKIQIEKEDIYIADGRGKQLYYIRAPGEIQIAFRKISLLEPLAHISGEISALLQVPLVEGPLGIRFDFPYPVIPETSLLSQRCDAHSGVIKRELNGQERSFCRYCDLCQTSAVIERGLNRGHKYLPGLGRTKQEVEFSRFCNRLDSKTYSLKRTVRLPGKAELERQVRQNFGGVAHEIKRRFDKGRGKFEVQLHLLSSEAPTQTAADFYKTTDKCKCCNPHLRGGDISCLIGRFLSCNQEDCKSQHAQQCLAQEKMVACYTTVFNYRVTTNWNEVRQFLALKGIGEHLRPKPGPRRPKPVSVSRQPKPVPRQPKPHPRQPRPQPQPQPQPPVLRSRNPRPNPVVRPVLQGSSLASTLTRRKSKSESAKSEDDGGKKNCITAMPDRFRRLRKYCEKFWNTGFCCPRCPRECPNFKYD